MTAEKEYPSYWTDRMVNTYETTGKPFQSHTKISTVEVLYPSDWEFDQMREYDRSDMNTEQYLRLMTNPEIALYNTVSQLVDITQYQINRIEYLQNKGIKSEKDTEVSDIIADEDLKELDLDNLKDRVNTLEDSLILDNLKESILKHTHRGQILNAPMIEKELKNSYRKALERLDRFNSPFLDVESQSPLKLAWFMNRMYSSITDKSDLVYMHYFLYGFAKYIRQVTSSSQLFYIRRIITNLSNAYKYSINNDTEGKEETKEFLSSMNDILESIKDKIKVSK